jgi:hypothetical protein
VLRFRNFTTRSAKAFRAAKFDAGGALGVLSMDQLEPGGNNHHAPGRLLRRKVCGFGPARQA